ncbi:MAG: type III-B CRISPR module-associated protein Cmr5 [Gracilibacteraceae bacterium]|jgi:CRISPR-associated protein Cmr5|nr:type III-B CRISPR module-associated protein Cmr5 [Gracilibacteraceae bacterium]
MKQAVIESGRAEFALNAVKNVVAGKNEKAKKEYKSYAKKFPTLVLANGLAAAVAFAVDKGGSYAIVYNNISDWLIKSGYFANPTRLEEYVCAMSSDEYRVVTNEVLALLEWLKRFASGLIEGDADDLIEGDANEG